MHLTLRQRKALCGRTIILEVMAPHAAQATATGIGDVFDTAHEAALARVTQAMSHPFSPDQIRLDDYLHQEAKTLVVNGDSYSFAPLVRRTLQQISNEYTKINCERCAGAQVCNGGPNDDFVVARGGLCLLPFLTAFRLAREESEAYYEQFATDFASLRKPRVLFQTIFDPKPHSLGVATSIGGNTEYRDREDDLTSIITLHLGVEDFDLESLHASLYVLFHECICHAYNGIRPGMSPRIATTPSDRFAEGWMDWVASRIFDRVANGKLLRSDLPVPSREQFEQGERLRRARCDISSGKPREKREKAPRALGTQAARLFQEFLVRLYGSSQGAKHFLRLSLDWNLERDLAPHREDFASYVNRCLNHGGLPDELRLAELAVLVRNYLETSDLQVFLPD